MAVANLRTTSVPADLGRKPRDVELDLFGLTHTGKVRKANQDHFLVCTVHQQMVVHGTSLPNTDHLPLRGERLATILLVADGVGGGQAGGEASQVAVEAVTRYVTSTMLCVHAHTGVAEQDFLQALRAAAIDAHQAVRAVGTGREDTRSMATTLTLAIFVWPTMYVVQVGDSRCYLYMDGVLRQVTRDQTVGQYMVDVGALPAERLAESPLNRVLSSAIGGSEAEPVVSRHELNRTARVLLCSDGLTKHVSNDEITERIKAEESSEQFCRALLDRTLERGGSDNITVLAGRLQSAPHGAAV
ncbi:MAG: serine/threonine-protein phosphatase [Gemmatimonadetes bacterium]|nr:serine/threonine-protein phosphatase [Gemmatimonadota bacterium]